MAARSVWNICARASRPMRRQRREVILTGGAYNSPQLLMLSGIGPAEELRKHGIPVLVDLPGVGKKSRGASADHSASRDEGADRVAAASAARSRNQTGGAVVLHRDRPVRGECQ